MSPESAPILNVSGLVKRFGGFFALDGLSFHVASGEILGLVGPNGSGKTTFLKSLVGLVAVWHGSIRLGEADMTKMRSSERMRLAMTYMSELAVFPDLTIEENIRIGSRAL